MEEVVFTRGGEGGVVARESFTNEDLPKVQQEEEEGGDCLYSCIDHKRGSAQRASGGRGGAVVVFTRED